MSHVPSSDPASATHHDPAPAEPAHRELEDYAGGYIQARHGYIPLWLLVVYAVLCAWGLYYGYQYWSGLGPGRF